MERNHQIEDFKSLRRVPWNKGSLSAPSRRCAQATSGL